MNRRSLSYAIVLVTIPVGIAWRMLPLHLPWVAWKYGGSALWTVALYWSVAAILPRLHPRSVALVSLLLSSLVEFSRLIDQPQLEAFRRTLAGKLLLGRIFSLKDIVAYWITIAVLFLIDHYRVQSSAASRIESR